MRSRLLVIGAAAAVLLAGCVPSSGSVQRVDPVTGQGPLAGQGVRVLAQPPAPGATPEQLTRQFLLACADPDDEFAIARSFLDPATAARWNPRSGATLYAGDPSDLQLTAQGSTVTVTGQREATITGGDYALADGPVESQVQRRFHFVRVGSEWRLSGVPDGILLSSALLFAFKPVDLYFFAPDLRRLVPDRVFLLASREKLAQAAVGALLRGPSPQLRDAVRSVFPPGARLASPVVLRGGVLNVELDLGGRPADRAALAAQLLWTAAQLPEVGGVRLRIDGQAYTPGGVPVLNADPDALGYNPNALPAAAPAYYVVAGRNRGELRSTDGARVEFTGPNGALRHPAVGLDRGLAGLDCHDGRCGLYVGRLGDVRLQLRLVVAGSLTAPSWDPVSGTVWTVQRSGDLVRVWAVPPSGRPTVVAAPQLAGLPVLALRLARDGARVALVVLRGGAPTVLAGVVEHDRSALRIEHLTPVAPSLVGAVDLAWGDAGHLVVLARSAQVPGGVLSPYRVRLDGSEAPQPVVGTALGGQPVSVAAGPGRPVLVAIPADGPGAGTRVLQLQNQTWVPLAGGMDPTYPG